MTASDWPVGRGGGERASCGRLCTDPSMAVMGVQVVVSLLAASIMQKLAPHCSFARWLLCNGSLHRYKHPSEEELRALAGKQRPKTKRDRRMNGVTDDKPLSVPRDIDLHLDTSPITAVDALVLRYFLEYQWFVDFAVYATAVYVFTEGYGCVVEPQREMNLGVLWCLLTVFFSVKVFFMVMRHYFRSEEGGERSVCLTFAFFFLLLAMVALVVREDYLEFGLEPGGCGGPGPGRWPWAPADGCGAAHRAGQRQQQPGERPEATGMGLDAAPRQAGLQAGAGGPLLLPGCLPDLPGAALGPDAPRCPPDDGRQTPDSGSAPREFPGSGTGGGAVDQAHLAGLPAARAHGQTDGADPVGLGLQHGAALGRGGAVRAAPGGHPPPPAGLPGPGRALGAADAEGSGTHRRRGDPAQDHEDLLLRARGQPAVLGTHHPHPALRAAPQDVGAPLVGAVPGAPSRPRGSGRGTIASRR
ncbi:transmembrane protein 161A isoform X3 [Numida meleagris]|uniref:transmembrane protein 161A isoform X3 n=1 Tax=Numida meleagris TaxID=8996 RepID=UPI000B3E03A5|nr:transmembrane protein 161A isoform X3 [Numida meleagris]